MDVATPKFVLDIITANFEAANTKTFITRVIYAGIHGFSNPNINFKSYLQQNIKSVNSASGRNAEAFGFALIYDKHFIIVLESSEETITLQIKYLITNTTTKFGRMKLLMAYHNINKRWFSSWQNYFATPPNLFTKMNPSAALEYHMEILQTCLDKVNRLCALVKENDQITFDGMTVLDPIMETLPESALIDYILGSPHILDLTEYSQMYETLPDYTFSFEICWPPPCDFTPRVTGSLAQLTSFVDPLPKEAGFEQEEEEEEKVEIPQTEDEDEEGEDED